MTDLLGGVVVVDLSWGSAGPISTMLLAEMGAEVARVVPPGGDPYASPASPVWDRDKRVHVLDLSLETGRRELRSLVAAADVLVDSCPPAVLGRLGLDRNALMALTRLVHCSISAYGPDGPDRPGIDLLVQARTGMMFEQPGRRPGPIPSWAPMPSFGAGLLAAIGVVAALRERQHSGLGQRVDTSMLQGVLAWTTMPWTRVERPTPGYDTAYRFRDISATPCYEAGDHRWLHPMPEVVPVVLKVLGLDQDALTGSPSGTHDERLRFQESVQTLLMQRPRDEWIAHFSDADLRCQPVQSIAEAYVHPQAAAVEAVRTVDAGGVPVRQFGRPFQVTTVAGGAPSRHRIGRPAAPLSGITVLDFGLALAGPYGPMLLADLGADVIRVDNVNAPRATDNQVWAACQRGKRSIALDLKSPAGREIVSELLARADVIHHNMRPGVAERLGIGFEQVRVVNPNIVYCHVTGFGATGPLAAAPGSDQMCQALSGLDHEQGATAAGGHPTWNRLGFTDHGAAVLSVLGVLGALVHNDRTGDAALVETSITNAAALFTSQVALGEGITRFPGLDRDQTGLGPLYRLYRTIDGWLCVAAVRPDHWRALVVALDLDRLLDDARFIDVAARHVHAGELASQFEARLATKPAREWLAVLDAAGVPAEIVSDTFIDEWFDDPRLRAHQLVASYDHAVWGRTEQLGLLWNFSATPGRLDRPPVLHGQHSREILAELGRSNAQIEGLLEGRVTSVPAGY